MDLPNLLDQLEYTKSENYLREDNGDFNRSVEYGHLFRKAAEYPCYLKGVYALRESNTVVPVVYVCDVDSEANAEEIHHRVWNQDSVPFLILRSRKKVRIYPGFNKDSHDAFENAGIDRVIETLNATAIDSGETWKNWGRHIKPAGRLNRKLLKNLREIDRQLQTNGLQQDISHALIGKYVYLHYLRDRNILSTAKLERFGIAKKDVFGRDAKLDALQTLCEKLDGWLNGSIFPIDFAESTSLQEKHVSCIARTFSGDEPQGSDQWQLHLDFDAFDFSYIPIETLSVVYEQFLHMPAGKNTNRGRDAGAYYTPIPIVNLMLSEMEEQRPLQKGMRIFDPACGSGAFLVQAFRRLIEKEFPPEETKPSLFELRDLLEHHFYGLDTDRDACNITRFSLILTLLDYVYPPDLEGNRPGPKPKLPDLKNNIFHGNFFDKTGDWQRIFQRKKADWVVGNPPWKQLEKGKLRREDEPAVQWMQEKKKDHPVANCQIAQAFAWRATEYVDSQGEIAFFLPAMTLFGNSGTHFRSRFLIDMSIHTVINFSNFRRILSGHRFREPAIAVFYQKNDDQETAAEQEDSIRIYSPLVANQEVTRHSHISEYGEIWNLLINVSDIKDISVSNLLDGSALPWKIAFWGSNLDAALLRSVKKKVRTFQDMENAGSIAISEGLQLRKEDCKEPVQAISLPQDALTVDMQELKENRRFFVLPSEALIPNPSEKEFVRKGRGNLSLDVCQPPHVFVSAARTFAVYVDHFLIIPGRQIGIVSATKDTNLLKAIALFLNSDFAFYFELFTSSSVGVGRARSTIQSLRSLPTPLMDMDSTEIKEWADYHDVLAEKTYNANGNTRDLGKEPVLQEEDFKHLNELVYDSLKLSARDRALVEDMIHVRFALNDAGIEERAVRQPNECELQQYGLWLRDGLDDYIHGVRTGRHDVKIIYDDHSGMVSATLVLDAEKKRNVSVLPVDHSEAKALKTLREHIRQRRTQWVYFDRNLRIYEENTIYNMKPLQLFHWTRSQARIDAIDIISEAIGRGN